MGPAAGTSKFEPEDNEATYMVSIDQPSSAQVDRVNVRQRRQVLAASLPHDQLASFLREGSTIGVVQA